MSTNVSRTCRLLFAVAVLAAVAGCATATATPPPRTATSTTSVGATTTRPAVGPLASVDPCTLLTDAQAAAAHLTKKGPQVMVGIRDCAWHYQATDPTQDFAVVIGIDDHRGLADLNFHGEQTKQLTVQGYPAMQDFNGLAVCSVLIGTSSTSNVSVGVSADVQRSCTLANAFVPLVMSNLPKH
jgi:hypothetical protein